MAISSSKFLTLVSEVAGAPDADLKVDALGKAYD